MLIRPRPGGLFWKLVLALWMCMLAAVAGGITFQRITGLPLGPDDHLEPGFPLIPLISAGIAIFITGVLLAWYLSRPLHQLRWAVHRVAEGNFDTRVQPLMGRRRDEIVDLAHEFDRMTTQLQKLTESRQQLLHDVSHELRSPLTRMQVAIGLLRQEPSQAAALIERIQRESERLDGLIEELLTLHRLEAGAASAVCDRVDVIELLRAIADDADFEARASSRSVLIDAPGEFVTAVNGELVYRALENVVRNAVKFTPPTTGVEVSARTTADGSELLITVKDRGPGVPPHMLHAIFEPFTRVDDGSDVSRGAGLGLAIARRAVILHGGRIEATLREGGGLEVTIHIPASGAGTRNSFQGAIHVE
jgi:signal transduction histidine kinase